MKKTFRNSLAALLAGGLLLSACASADPAVTGEQPTSTELSLLGPDRTERAPQRAVRAPVQPTEPRRPEVKVAPPVATPKPFVYEKRNCKTLTNVPYDIQGEEFFCYQRGLVFHHFDEGNVHMWTPVGRFPVNALGAMGADREFMRLEYGQRLGVWANGRIANDDPKTIVEAMVARMQETTCGTWSNAKATTIAGVPATIATGYDEYANYFYEVVALKRFGNTYSFATRVPYNTRYNAERNAELAWIVSHMHPTSWSE